MLIYSTLFIAVIIFIIFSFLHSKVFGDQPNQSDFQKISNYKNGVFHNNSPTKVMAAEGSFIKVLKEWINKPPLNTPNKPMEVVQTNLKEIDTSVDSVTWFGHSSYLLVVAGKKILVDPVFYRASPIPIFGKSFPMSYDYNPDDFPEIDFLVITHDHYDHLDYRAVTELLPKIKHMVCAAGIEAHLKLWGAQAEKITTLSWYQEFKRGDLTFTSLPARHFSGRKFKRGETLWCSFALESENKKIYIGGDSGYDTHFQEIGNNHGPFDLAILECGQYGKYWPNIHLLPEETALAAQQLHAKALLPVHWGKFALSTHPWTEPMERLLKVIDKEKIKLLTPKIGETLSIDDTYKTTTRWRT